MGIEELNSNQYQRSFPPQKISLKQKTKKWREQCVDYVIRCSTTAQHFSANPSRIHDIWENENIVEGIYNKKELAYVTEPFGVKDKLPARLKEFNIIKPLLESLKGEELNRPFSFSVARTSEDAKNDRLENLKSEFDNYIMQAILSNVSPDMQEEFMQAMQSGQIVPPEDIVRHQNETYKDLAEHFCQVLVDSEIQRLDLRTEFIRGYDDYLKNGEEIFYVGEEYGHVNVRRVIPSTFYYEYTPNLLYIDDSSWCSERMVLSYADFYDKYGDEIEEKDLDEILKWIQDNNTGQKQTGEHTWAPEFFQVPQLDPQNPFSTTGTSIEVWKVHWKSFRKVLFVTLNNKETNQPETIVVDENYAKTGEEESIEESWIMQVWQGHRVRKNIYFGIHPINVASDMNDPTSIKLPYTGLASHGKSVVELLRPMQMMYLSLWYRVELLLARDNGRVLVMDATQIPKSLKFDVPTWAHYMKAAGIALVNPYESGWGIPGRDGSRPSAFTGFTSLDLGVGQSIQQYMGLIDKVEQMAMQIIGFTPQRMGQVGHRDLSGTTQQALSESYNTTAHIVYMHDKAKERVLRKLLNTALALRWRDDDDYLSYIGTDGMRIFMHMPHTAIETMDLRVVDSQEEAKKMQTLQQLYQPAMQNGATLADIAKMLTSHNTNEIKLLLEDIERRKEQMQQQQMEQQNQVQQMQFQQVETDRQTKVDQQNADRQMDKYKIDTEASLKKEELQIKMQDLMKEEPLKDPDPLDIERLEFERRKAEQDFLVKNKEMEMKTTLEVHRLDVERKRNDEQIALDRLAQFEKHKEAEDKLEFENRRLQAELKSEKEQADAELQRMKTEHNQKMEQLKLESQKMITLEKEKYVAQLQKEMSLLKEQAKVDKTTQQQELSSKEKIEKLKVSSNEEINTKQLTSKEKIEKLKIAASKGELASKERLEKSKMNADKERQKTDIASKEKMSKSKSSSDQASNKKESDAKGKYDKLKSEVDKIKQNKDLASKQKLEKLEKEVEKMKAEIIKDKEEQEKKSQSPFGGLFGNIF